jgi:hypothetical protein
MLAVASSTPWSRDAPSWYAECSTLDVPPVIRRWLAYTTIGSAGLGASIAIACGPARLPSPAWAPQPTSALSEVPYPPPPARVEGVPKQPSDDAVWIDGEWTWQARRYSWRAGRWVVPPPNARFAPWTTVRDARGTLFLASGVWRDAHGAELSDPAPLAIGVPAIGPIITPEGEKLPSGPPLFGDASAASAPAAPATSALDASRSEADAGTMDVTHP